MNQPQQPPSQICPECQGTGCDPEPLKAPADDSAFLFPRCSTCGGKGKINAEQMRRYLKRRKSE
jgi:hypothetical protein